MFWGNDSMKKRWSIVDIKMNILMGSTVSFVLSLVGTLKGGHFTVISWLIAFLISFTLALIIGFVVPINKIDKLVFDKYDVDPDSMKGNLISGIVSDLIYTPVISITMVVIMLTNAAKHAPEGATLPLSRVIPSSLLLALIVGYVVIIIAKPFYLKRVLKGLQSKK